MSSLHVSAAHVRPPYLFKPLLSMLRCQPDAAESKRDGRAAGGSTCGGAGRAAGSTESDLSKALARLGERGNCSLFRCPCCSQQIGHASAFRYARISRSVMNFVVVRWYNFARWHGVALVSSQAGVGAGSDE